MMGVSEAEIVAQAQSILGQDEEILGAGYFGLANLSTAAGVGGAAAGIASADFGASVGASTLVTILSSIVTKHVAAEAQGATLRLLVAITPKKIHVLNDENHGELAREFATFERDAVEVSIKRFGASRRLTLTDDVTGHSIELHGAVTWPATYAEGDKVVLDLLQ